MTGASRWPHLFSPLALGGLTVENRIVMPAMDPSLADAAGRATDAMVAHYAARARGGAGLVITGNLAVHPRGRLSPWMGLLADDAALPSYAGLCREVHAAGGRIFFQLSHAGRQTLSQFAGGPPLSASALPCPVMRETPEAMDEGQVGEAIAAFAAAARRSREAGADGVELHMAHGYLVCQFLSPYSNRRTDAWGGDAPRRLRFAVEIVRAVRAAVGDGFPVQCRLSADERVEGGITPDLACEQAAALVRAGADALSVSACNYESYRFNMPAYYLPEATYRDLAAQVRAHLRGQGLATPVVAVGRFRRADLAEETLARGDADLIAMGRALIADPALPAKLRAGSPERVRPCVACNRCAESVTQGPLRCLVNPEAGRLPDAAPDAPPAVGAHASADARSAVGAHASADARSAVGAHASADARSAVGAPAPRRVLVVGGGPAGITAAVEAARRGHAVRLVDAAPRLGGKIRAGAVPPHKQGLAELAEWLTAEVAAAGVTVELGRAWSPAEVAAAPADVVLLAVGAEPVPPPDIPGLAAHPAVLDPEAAVARAAPVRHAVIIGAGPEGCEVADALAHRPERPAVTLVERRPKVGLGLPSSVRALLQARLEAAGVRLCPGRTVAGLEPAGVALADRRGRPAEVLPPADVVVFAIGVAAARGWDEVRALPHVTVLGDAARPASILEAVAEGYRVGRSL